VSVIGFEVVRKDIHKPKLTIAKDRVSLKLPVDCDVETEHKLTAYSQEIAAELQPGVGHTLRGHFKVLNDNLFQIALRTGSGDPYFALGRIIP
jgi:hypothetical protein